MVRAVLDTNILVSAAVFDGTPLEILRLGFQHKINLLTSPPIIAEFRRILREKFGDADEEAFQTEKLFRNIAIIVEPSVAYSTVKDDPPDNRILEAAVQGQANFIVTGDRAHILPLGSFHGIPIVTPRRFINKIRE